MRGAAKAPGQVRKTQNWIGGSRPGNAAFVPPPPEQLPALLSNLEKYGRMGRLLIALMLEHWKVLPHPLLYLSLFIRRHQAEYYRRLSRVRSDGDWEGWLDFFLDGVATVNRRADDLESGVRLDLLRQHASHERGVVHDQDADERCGHSISSSPGLGRSAEHGIDSSEASLDAHSYSWKHNVNGKRFRFRYMRASSEGPTASNASDLWKGSINTMASNVGAYFVGIWQG